MTELFTGTIQIWGCGTAISRHEDIVLVYDFDTRSLVLKQYPYLVADSKSFVGLTLLPSCIRLLSSEQAPRATEIIPIMARETIRAHPDLDISSSSQEEDLVTLQMCCSLIDTTIEANSRIDVLPNDGDTDSDNVELLLDLLGDTTKKSEPVEVEIELSEEVVNAFLTRDEFAKHSESLAPENTLVPSTEISTQQNSWPSRRDEYYTASTIATTVDQEDIVTQGTATANQKHDSRDHLIRWNNFAEANGAAPRVLADTGSHTRVTQTHWQPVMYNKIQSGTATATGGYLSDRRRNYNILDDCQEEIRAAQAARRRNRNGPKLATHSTAQNTYIQPYFTQDSIMTKHGSFW